MTILHVVYNQGDVWDVYFKTWTECMNFINVEVYPWAIQHGYPLIWAYCS